MMHARRATAARSLHAADGRRGAEKVGGILRRALDDRGLSRRLPRRVCPEVWESAVGAQMAARAQPTVLSHGTLHLLVEDHRWRDQLDAARLFLLERINLKLGKGTVRALQFGLAHAGALDAARRRAALDGAVDASPPIEPERVLGSARLAGGLREAFLRAAEAAQRRRP
jgi:predicted nucleic acid-binding Zn ribbon protein